MKIVIQCAGNKHEGRAGFGLRRPCDNLPVKFVARPDLAPPSATQAYARPDDPYDGSRTWRQFLVDYNRESNDNPARLSRAYQLYRPSAYQALARRFGVDKVFILSAGWGLIPAHFLTPEYDITFSSAPNVKPHAKRNKHAGVFADCQLLPDDGEEIIFLGGQDYLPLFCALTGDLKAAKKVFFNTQDELRLGEGFVAERFLTTRRMNWHYECAQSLVDGTVR